MFLVECKYIGRMFFSDCCDYPDKCQMCCHNTWSDEPYFPFRKPAKSFFEKRRGL